MADARFRIVFAGPHVAFQDGGRPGLMRFGVTRSGPMDSLAHAAANLAVGRPADATAVEVSLGGLVLDCVEGAVTLAVAGGGFVVEHAARRLGSGAVLRVRDTDGGTAGAERRIPCPVIARPLHRVAVVPGPQDHRFQPDALPALLSAQWQITTAYDRMGMRLDGPPLALADALSIPSEAVVAGSIQVSGDGIPTILMRDHQTTGGYPKIATVLACDLDRVAQLRPRDRIAFVAVSPAKAIARARRHASLRRRWLGTLAGQLAAE